MRIWGVIKTMYVRGYPDSANPQRGVQILPIIGGENRKASTPVILSEWSLISDSHSQLKYPTLKIPMQFSNVQIHDFQIQH